MSLLWKGLNFAVAFRRVPIWDITAKVEERLLQIRDMPDVTLARNRIVRVLSNARNTRTNMSSCERAELSDLKMNRYMVITFADKFEGTVLLYRKDYDAKMQTILKYLLNFVA